MLVVNVFCSRLLCSGHCCVFVCALHCVGSCVDFSVFAVCVWFGVCCLCCRWFRHVVYVVLFLTCRVRVAWLFDCLLLVCAVLCVARVCASRSVFCVSDVLVGCGYVVVVLCCAWS